MSGHRGRAVALAVARALQYLHEDCKLAHFDLKVSVVCCAGETLRLHRYARQASCGPAAVMIFALTVGGVSGCRASPFG